MVTNKIKKYRTERNILQADLAIELNCDKQTISRYETGHREPSLEMALRLAKFFDVPAEELFSLK